ncbi:uncharacterized protein [Typha angustifolia]
MQATWNPWLHLGSTRTCSPGANSERQMAHSDPVPANPRPRPAE